MTSTGGHSRRMRMMDAADDELILPDTQVEAMNDELVRLYEQRTALDTEIARMHAVLHESGEARLRKQRRHETAQ